MLLTQHRTRRLYDATTLQGGTWVLQDITSPPAHFAPEILHIVGAMERFHSQTRDRYLRIHL